MNVNWDIPRGDNSVRDLFEIGQTHGEPHGKKTSGLLSPRKIVSGIDCGSLAQLEYIQKTRQRVSTEALIRSEITLIVK